MQSWLENPVLLRRAVIVGAILLVTVPVIAFFATHGYVTIESEENTDVTITLESGQSVATNKSKIGQFVATGNYIASSTDQLGVARQSLEVKPFSITTIKLTVPKVPQAVPITNAQINSLSPGDIPSFILRPSGFLTTISENGTFKTVVPDVMFKSISWIGNGEGYGLGTTDNVSWKAYHVQNGRASLIPLPQPAPYTSTVPFTVARDGTIYVVQSDQLYRKLPTSSSFTQVDSAEKIVDLLSATTNSIVGVHNKGSSDDPFAIDLIHRNFVTKTTRTFPAAWSESPDTALHAEWNNDGSHLLIASQGNIKIYDHDGNEQLILPDATATSPRWVDATHILYGSKNAVMSYDITAKSATAVAAAPSYVTIQSLSTVEQDNYYIYGRTSVGISIYRVKKGDTATIEKLGESNMQTLSESCELTYAGFTTPTIMYRSYDDKTTECDSTIRSYLTSIRIDPKDVTIVQSATMAQ